MVIQYTEDFYEMIRDDSEKSARIIVKAQNILIFAKKSYLDKNPLLKIEFEKSGGFPLPLVHPTLYLQTVDKLLKHTAIEQISFTETLNKLLIVIARNIKRKINSLTIKL